MKKFTTVALAGAIALGGLGVANLTTPQTTAHAAMLNNIDVDSAGWNAKDVVGGQVISATLHLKDLNTGGTYTAGTGNKAFITSLSGSVTYASGVSYTSNANGYAYPSVTVPANLPAGTYKVFVQTYQPSTSNWLVDDTTYNTIVVNP